ncbi:hypothetical protein F442_09982 [Phytophthora nicotianae P10297]|uniref:Uncharacterized protein n=1 Tax=Phytophthora nicotianae P10297 TaxID=1317064 RepID=W2Z8E3_PHYNI|nr:hypothetical protein F442_09982 [Phytophthora nicotianae P10297]
MGNKHSRKDRHSAPDARQRRSFWRQRGRLSAPCDRTLESPDIVQPRLPTISTRPRHQLTNSCPAGYQIPLHIRVTNLRQNEVLAFPLVLIEGTIEHVGDANLPDSALYVQAVTHDVEKEDELKNSWVGSVCWPVVRESGHFKAFVHISHPGKFNIHLRIANATYQLRVRFEPQKTKWIVRFHYQKPSDSYQGFDAPSGVDNSDSDACQRLKFNAMVLQSTIAELFHRAGFARKTFAVELDADGFPVVNVLHSNHTISQARRMTDSQLLTHLTEDIQAAEAQNLKGYTKPSTASRVKHVVLLGGPHFDPRVHKVSNYRELVGGDMIVNTGFGLFTWPRSLNELTSCCFNCASIAPELTMDQCSVQQTYWASYSGALSILLHLLSFSFGLKYRSDGVMRKSFRQTTRLLVVMEPRSGKKQLVAVGRPVGDGRFYKLESQALKPVGATLEGIYLDELSIGELAIHCRWINPKLVKHVVTTNPATAA